MDDRARIVRAFTIGDGDHGTRRAKGDDGTADAARATGDDRDPARQASESNGTQIRAAPRRRHKIQFITARIGVGTGIGNRDRETANRESGAVNPDRHRRRRRPWVGRMGPSGARPTLGFDVAMRTTRL